MDQEINFVSGFNICLLVLVELVIPVQSRGVKYPP